MENSPNDIVLGYQVTDYQTLRRWEKNMKLSMRQRIKNGFVKNNLLHKLKFHNGEHYRSFETMADYKKWYGENMPSWMQ